MVIFHSYVNVYQRVPEGKCSYSLPSDIPMFGALTMWCPPPNVYPLLTISMGYFYSYFSWENPLFLWAIFLCRYVTNYQRVPIINQENSLRHWPVASLPAARALPSRSWPNGPCAMRTARNCATRGEDKGDVAVMSHEKRWIFPWQNVSSPEGIN